MTSPELDQHFIVDGNAIGPQPYMQLRPVASNEVLAVSAVYNPTDGLAKNDLLQAVQADWTNDTPVTQWVYGMVTRSGARVSLQARSRGYLSDSHGVMITDAATVIDPTTFDLTESSRFGTGANIGVGGLLAAGTGFCIVEMRENSNTDYLMPAHIGWYLVEPGQKLTGRVTVTFISEQWENTTIDGGSDGTESSVLSGDLRLDLFACPTVADPPPRLQPSVVGGPTNVRHDEEIDLGIADTTVSIDLPTGLATGDVLVVLFANNTGAISEIGPLQDGWTLAQSRDGGYLDVHLNVYMRTVTDADIASPPAHYDFSNGFLAEGIGIMFALRNTINFDGSDGGSGWFISSDLSTWKLVEDQVAPSISRGGELLIALSYVNHDSWATPFHQTIPDGMTELIQVNTDVGSFAVATLNNPPNPTGPRKFLPSADPTIPYFSGHSVTAALLVPGIQQL